MNIDLLLYIALALIIMLIIADLICLKWLIVSIMIDVEDWEEKRIEKEKLNEEDQTNSGC